MAPTLGLWQLSDHVTSFPSREKFGRTHGQSVRSKKQFQTISQGYLAIAQSSWVLSRAGRGQVLPGHAFAI